MTTADQIHTTKLPKQCTEEWFKTVILNRLDVSNDDIHAKIVYLEDITGGYMSYMTRVKLEWSGSNIGEDFPRSLMLKILTLEKITEELKHHGLDEVAVEQMVDSMTEGSERFHDNECYMYNQFLRKPGLNVKAPRCFSAINDVVSKTDAVILMEDISNVSGNIPLHQGFMVEQVKRLIDSMVEVQAESLKDTEWMMHTNPMRAKDLEVITTQMENYLEMAKKRHPKEFAGIAYDQIAPFARLDYWMELVGEGFYEWPVLVHGDLWTNNMMFVKGGDGQFTDELEAIIDWQLTHRGQPGEDICLIIAVHLDCDQRKAHEKELLMYYYGRLEKRFGGSAPFPFSYIEDWYKKSMSIPALRLLMFHALLSDKFTDEQATCTAKRSPSLLRDVIDGSYKQQKL